MNIAPLLKKIQECHNFVRSLATTLDIPYDLKKEYDTHYSNTVQISMGIEKSLEFEDEALHHPIPVQQTFNMTSDNIKNIADVAYKTLSNQREFYTKLNEKVILKRALKEAGEDGMTPTPMPTAADKENQSERKS